eukprot:CAMPEP_0181390610 /NCGR_PEP_ID=MMETSP1106-20121128/25580_1 /TAXON_ID=81844 /ORGANISM="Mantoniella antarctica, Strain SL-175" /LENGTH=478 /DNA_ID=CAMNT_0023511539 /DNA_START=625 /DNA_END=2064 /DNA_ORIENTATION=-
MSPPLKAVALGSASLALTLALTLTLTLPGAARGGGRGCGSARSASSRAALRDGGEKTLCDVLAETLVIEISSGRHVNLGSAGRGLGDVTTAENAVQSEAARKRNPGEHPTTFSVFLLNPIAAQAPSAAAARVFCFFNRFAFSFPSSFPTENDAVPTHPTSRSSSSESPSASPLPCPSSSPVAAACAARSTLLRWSFHLNVSLVVTPYESSTRDTQKRPEHDDQNRKEHPQHDYGPKVEHAEPSHERPVLRHGDGCPPRALERHPPQPASGQLPVHYAEAQPGAVAGEHHVHRQERHEVPQVVLPDGVVHPPAEVVEPGHAAARHAAELAPRRAREPQGGARFGHVQHVVERVRLKMRVQVMGGHRARVRPARGEPGGDGGKHQGRQEHAVERRHVQPQQVIRVHAEGPVPAHHQPHVHQLHRWVGTVAHFLHAPAHSLAQRLAQRPRRARTQAVGHQPVACFNHSALEHLALTEEQDE